MKYKRTILIFLIIPLLILFLPTMLQAFDILSFNIRWVQLIGFSLTLISLFANNYFLFIRQEYGFAAVRGQEIRSHRMEMLDYVESWVLDFNSILDKIRSIRQLSKKDKEDNKSIISKADRESIADDLIRLDSQRLLAFAKAADIIGIRTKSKKLDDLPAPHQDLLQNLYSLGNSLEKLKQSFSSSSKIPDVDKYNVPIAKIASSLDQIRQDVEL